MLSIRLSNSFYVMKKSYLILVAILLLLGGCAETPIEFSYGDKGFIFPGDGKVKPVFSGKEPKGTFSVYPSTIKIDPATGVIDVDSKTTIPGYKYLVRFVTEGEKEMAHAYVEIAGLHYPSRYFDLTNPADTVAKLLLPDNQTDRAEGRFTIASYLLSDVVVPNSNATALRRAAPVDTAAVVQGIINNRTGTLDLNQLADGVFRNEASGKINLVVQYETTQHGKKISGEIQYMLFRQPIRSREYRAFLRDWFNMDKIMEARAVEMTLSKKIESIRTDKSWGLGYKPGNDSDIFTLVKSMQNAPPPGGKGGI